MQVELQKSRLQQQKLQHSQEIITVLQNDAEWLLITRTRANCPIFKNSIINFKLLLWTWDIILLIDDLRENNLVTISRNRLEIH